MTSVGGHSALRGTVCTRAGHCALRQDVGGGGDILHGGGGGSEFADSAFSPVSISDYK